MLLIGDGGSAARKGTSIEKIEAPRHFKLKLQQQQNSKKASTTPTPPPCLFFMLLCALLNMAEQTFCLQLLHKGEN